MSGTARSRGLHVHILTQVTAEQDIANFTGITGASVEQATFFLESSGGNLEVRPCTSLTTQS